MIHYSRLQLVDPYQFSSVDPYQHETADAGLTANADAIASQASQGDPSPRISAQPAHAPLRGYETMGLAPSGYRENTGNLGRCEVPVPISSQPLRVTHVSYTLVRGGLEQWLRSLARFLDPQRVRISRCIVLTPHVDPRMAADVRVPIEVGGPELVRQAASTSDVLLCSNVFPTGVFLPADRRPVCVTVAHGVAEWVREGVAQARPWLDHVVAVSENVRRGVGDDVSASVIRNGVDPEHLACSRSRGQVRELLGFLPNDFVVGFVGRFAPEKRADLLVEMLVGAPSHFKGLFVGWGPLHADLLRLANERIPGRFAIVSADCYLGDFYHAMDAFCLPSASEGCALALLEAMLCGLPVVATPVGAAPELLVDRVNGLLAEGTPARFLDAVRLVEQHPRWAHAIGEEGRATAQRWGLGPAMARQYEDLFHRLRSWKRTRDLSAAPPVSV
jgi:glycosyltransferase involved in cell wall biosynthesis